VREFLQQPSGIISKSAVAEHYQNRSIETSCNRADQGWLSTCQRTLIIIGVGGRTLVVDEVGCLERRGNRVECDRRMGKVETIG
jgi:hypothetical protein